MLAFFIPGGNTMYFHYKAGKRYLDLKGNLILSKNENLIEAKAKSAAPYTKNGQYVLLKKLGFRQKIYATFIALKFIWG